MKEIDITLAKALKVAFKSKGKLFYNIFSGKLFNGGKARRKQRSQGKGDKKADQSRNHHNNGKLPQNISNDATDKRERQKNNHIDHRNGESRKANLVSAGKGGISRLFTAFEMTVDIFKYHNGIVNQNTNNQ